jgi:predicted transcriptional regulator
VPPLERRERRSMGTFTTELLRALGLEEALLASTTRTLAEEPDPMVVFTLRAFYLTENQAELLEEIYKRGGATLAELAYKFCLSRVEANRDLMALEEFGLIRLAHRGDFVPMPWELTLAGLRVVKALAKK